MVKCSDLKCELVTWKWLSVVTWNGELVSWNGKCSDLKCELGTWNG